MRTKVPAGGTVGLLAALERAPDLAEEHLPLAHREVRHV
jgi:hypothetical protein